MWLIHGLRYSGIGVMVLAGIFMTLALGLCVCRASVSKQEGTPLLDRR